MNKIGVAKSHELWPYFQEHAICEGVNMNHHDDWLPSWRTFLAGINAVEEHEKQKRQKAALGEDS